MWEGLQIGSLNLSAVKPCDRCKVSPSHNAVANAMSMQTRCAVQQYACAQLVASSFSWSEMLCTLMKQGRQPSQHRA